MADTGKTIALIKALSGGGGGGLPSVTASDAGKVLGVNDSGVWGAEFLGGSGRKLKIEATYSDGAYVTNTQITPDEYYRAVASGYTCELWIGGVAHKLHLLMDNYNDFAFYKATLQDTSNVLVQINGFDQEYLTISIYLYDTRFIVTLTPTSADYSGTMDKTPQEITAAYNAGQEIVFSIPSMNAQLTPIQFLETGGAIIASAHIIYNLGNGDVMMAVATNSSASTYATSIYTLTPAT